MLSLLYTQPLLFIVVLLAMIVALSFHELAHAFVAYLLGDSTAQRMGRLTLNPLAHIDWTGLLLLVVAGFGWAKPVPFNPHNLRFRTWGPVLVSLAGPGSNLLLASIASVVFHLLLVVVGLPNTNALMVFLFYLVLINLALMFFNFLPIPPLDGSRLLTVIFSGPQHAQLRYWVETRGAWLLMGLVVLDVLFNIGLFSWLFHLVSLLTCNVFLGGQC